MKHIRTMTNVKPQCGNAWQEAACALAIAVNALLSFLGGTSPAFQYVEDKCDIPQPNTDA